MLRLLVNICLALLMLGMQQERVVHELQHESARLADDLNTALHSGGGEAPCALCPLLSGGSHALPGAEAQRATPAATCVHAQSQAVEAFVPTRFHYASRAPPPRA